LPGTAAGDDQADPRPSPAPRDAARTRGKILRAAQILFAREGYTTVGAREVSAEAVRQTRHWLAQAIQAIVNAES